MFRGLYFIQRKFPSFFNFGKDSNNTKLSKIMHHNFKEVLNSLKAVRNGYFFLNGGSYSLLELEQSPVIVNNENSVNLQTTEKEVGDKVEFNSKLFGSLGSNALEEQSVEGDFKEHIGIKTGYDSYTVYVSAKDIQRIRVLDQTTNKELVYNFDYKTHQEYFNFNLTPVTHVYKVIVDTWDEYTYISYSNRINTDLDRLGVLVGCKRRVYTNQKVESIYVDYFVNTETGNDSNHGLTIDKPFKTLTKALSMVNTEKNKIAFMGEETLVNTPINQDTEIYGNGRKSVINADFWLSPTKTLSFQNLVLNKFLINKRTINNMQKIINIVR